MPYRFGLDEMGIRGNEMNKVDYDKSKFKTDSYGNLIPVAGPKSEVR